MSGDRDRRGDDLWHRDEPQSPCVKVCLLHPETGLCLGCARSMAEIAGWAQMGAEERQKILDDLPLRHPAPRRRRSRG